MERRRLSASNRSLKLMFQIETELLEHWPDKMKHSEQQATDDSQTSKGNNSPFACACRSVECFKWAESNEKVDLSAGCSPYTPVLWSVEISKPRLWGLWPVAR